MTHILLAHAPEAEARARLVTAKLGALGVEVRRRVRARGSIEPRQLTAAVDNAACVVVLWSGGAAKDPALRAAARRARAAGKLAHWTGRDDGRAWRRLHASVSALTSPPPAKATRKPRGVTDAILVWSFVGLFGALCAGAYYLLP